MSKRLLFLLAIVHFVIAVVLLMLAISPIQGKTDPCAFWDTWVGGERFDYQVSPTGEWNLPSDVVPWPTFMGDGGGVETYWSDSQKYQYVIIYRDFIADGSPYGQHHICVYRRR